MKHDSRAMSFFVTNGCLKGKSDKYSVSENIVFLNSLRKPGE